MTRQLYGKKFTYAIEMIFNGEFIQRFEEIIRFEISKISSDASESEKTDGFPIFKKMELNKNSIEKI